MSVRRLRVPLVLTLALATLLAQAGSSLALFTESKAAAANTFSGGTWAFYLHNNPTPPTANTTAQVNLAMNATVPTAATLYQYSTDCAARAGRRLTRAAPSPTQATVCDYVNWRTAAQTAAMTLSGTVTLDIWATTDTTNTNRTGVLVAYLRDYNPTGGTYVEIANATDTNQYAVGRTTFYLTADRGHRHRHVHPRRRPPARGQARGLQRRPERHAGCLRHGGLSVVPAYSLGRA